LTQVQVQSQVDEAKNAGVQEGIKAVQKNPDKYGLFTQAQVNEAKTAGVQEATDGRVRPQT
jgi:hypothetical protein